MSRILLFALLIQVSKPFISYYLDKKPKKARTFAIMGVLCLILSFSLLVFTLSSLILFAIFLTITFGLWVLVDVSIDKYIVAISPTEKIKDNNIVFINIGAKMGAIFGSGLYLIFIWDTTSLNAWNQFFIFSILFTIPLIPIILLLKKIDEEPSVENHFKKVNRRNIILLIIFLVLFSVSYLYDWVLEPWIFTHFGPSGVSLFSIFLIFWILLQILGYFIARIFSNRVSKRTIIGTFMPFIGILFIIAPFLDLFTLLILITITQFFSGWVAVNWLSLSVSISKKKASIFQLMSVSIVISRVIFTPLGLYLSIFIPSEFIIVIAGICFMLSALPILFLKEEK